MSTLEPFSIAAPKTVTPPPDLPQLSILYQNEKRGGSKGPMAFILLAFPDKAAWTTQAIALDNHFFHPLRKSRFMDKSYQLHLRFDIDNSAIVSCETFSLTISTTGAISPTKRHGGIWQSITPEEIRTSTSEVFAVRLPEPIKIGK